MATKSTAEHEFSRADALTLRANLQSASGLAEGLREDLLEPELAEALVACANTVRFLMDMSVTADDDHSGGQDSLLGVLSEGAAWDALDLSEHLKSVIEGAAVGDAHDPVGSVAELLERVIDFTRACMDALAPQYVTNRAQIEHRLVALLTVRSTLRLSMRAQGAIRRAEEAADSAAESAGDRAEQSLSTEFDDLAKKQGRAANVFRGLTIALFLVVIGYAAAVALDAEKPSVELGQKLAVGIPVLLLAGYFNREAGHHRETARWASVLGAQLRSVRAYTVSMSPESAEELRLALGRRAFLESPDTQPASPEDGTTASLDPSVIREMTDLVRASRGQ